MTERLGKRSITPAFGAKILRHSTIERALAGAAGPSKWIEDATYADATQPGEIGQALIPLIHQHLETAKIGYLFREKMSARARVTLAMATKADPKLAFFTDLDLLIIVNWERWMPATPAARVALIDHELCHFGLDHDKDTGEKRYVLLHHDVEEFGAIVKRWGLWKEDLAMFAGEVREQIELLKDP